MNEKTKGKHQVSCSVTLTFFAIHPRDHFQIVVAAELISRYHPWANRSACVKVLALRDIEFAVLDPVTHGAFIHAGQAGNITFGFFLRYTPATLTDNDGDFALIIELGRLRHRTDNWLTMAHQGRWEPRKYAGILRRGRAVFVFFIPVAVVHTDADDLARHRHRRHKLHIIKRIVDRGIPRRRRKLAKSALLEHLPH